MKVWIRVILGVLLLLVGAKWCLQGSGAMSDGSPMDGQSEWLLIGGVVALVGLGVLIGGVRSLRSRPHE